MDGALDAAGAFIRQTLSAPGPPVFQGNLLCQEVSVRNFYSQRNHAPAWQNPFGISPEAHALLAQIAQAGSHGLSPGDYHEQALRLFAAKAVEQHAGFSLPSPETLAGLDLLLTDAFFLYASHLSLGKVRQESASPRWHDELSGAVPLLAQAIASRSVSRTLDQMAPSFYGYRRLRDAVAAYRDIEKAGGLPLVSSARRLQRGDKGPDVEALRRRLEAEHDLAFSPAPKAPDVFDTALETALTSFQWRHGIATDGKLGQETVAALTIPAGKKARLLERNLERWRWLPRNLEDRFVMVNLADFTLSAVEKGDIALTMKVVAGKTYRKTPIFSSVMRQVEFNPAWNVPYSIASHDILPELKKNPGYLKARGFQVISGLDGSRVDPASVNWSQVSAKNLNYRFRQNPGAGNALGRVKFIFPNPYAVYLHDTPKKSLFAKTRRVYSSGCIRVERVADLAEFALSGTPGWGKDTIARAMASGKGQTVTMARPLPVRILYWTAWADTRKPVVHFREDVYGRDQALAAALAAPPPRPGQGGR
jgi:murein L,D-transpeptidase YcbB/YkuD